MGFSLIMTEEAEEQLKAILMDPGKKRLARQLKKTLGHLQENPGHPGLRSHYLINSEKILGEKTWVSYVQNNSPQAFRILWVYGKNKGEIVLIGVIPHY